MTDQQRSEIFKRIKGSLEQWEDGAICAHEMANYIYGQASLLDKRECCELQFSTCPKCGKQYNNRIFITCPLCKMKELRLIWDDEIPHWSDPNHRYFK